MSAVSSCGRSGSAEGEQSIGLIARGARRLPGAPAHGGAIATEQAALAQVVLTLRYGLVGLRRDEQRIGGTIQLAHEARLAILLAGDDGVPTRNGVEDVRRADTHADVAVD